MSERANDKPRLPCPVLALRASAELEDGYFDRIERGSTVGLINRRILSSLCMDEPFCHGPQLPQTTLQSYVNRYKTGEKVSCPRTKDICDLVLANDLDLDH